MRAPGIALDALPQIDAILVTHNHYDHMDVATLSALARRPRDCRIVVPLGNDTILRRHDPALRTPKPTTGASGVALAEAVTVTLDALVPLVLPLDSTTGAWRCGRPS